MSSERRGGLPKSFKPPCRRDDLPCACTAVLLQNDVTHVWLVKTPDGELEGPFADSQEAADWAADDWDAVFSDPDSADS